MAPPKEQIQKLTHVEHILKRPDSYVGSVIPVTESYWVLHGNIFSQQSVTYSPALLKIFDEILVNAIDRNSSFPDDVKSISVTVANGVITVTNDGPLGGIAVEMHPTEKIWNPELTFGHLLTSTNYDDTQDRLVGGRNGYGAKLANVFSKKFSITITDGENGKKYSQTWEKNMTICHEPVIKKSAIKKSSVSVSFEPVIEISNDFIKIIEKRVYDANFCTSQKCKVSFQDQVLERVTPEKYFAMYTTSDAYTIKTDRWTVCIAPSQDGFQHISFVNGICTHKGGTHVDYVSAVITRGIIDELSNKIKLRPTQVRECLFIMVKATLVNPSFSSQVKSECTLSVKDFGSTLVVPDNFIKGILKTGIKDVVLALNKFKESAELKKTDGSSKKTTITGIPKLDDANWAGTSRSDRCTLIVTEGDSAKTLAIAGLTVVGRDLFGAFPLRGKCKNVRDASIKQLMANQEFSDLKKIIGLQQDKIYKSLSELRYGRLMIMTDADNDGSHIKGLILNMIHYFWPSLLDLGFLVSMVTPIIKATKGSVTQSFYTDAKFREANLDKTWVTKYYKGLGTSTSKEAHEYFRDLKKLTVAFTVDSRACESIILAFDKTKADDRKEWLLQSSNQEKSVNYGGIATLGISDFIHKDLINFSLADLRRSVAHVCDGLKPSQRKVLYACFMKNLNSDMKVAQLASFVSDKTFYHHGEVSLADTIVKLAQDFTGSNNINLLEPCGQFGTRLMGGKDSSQTRYIFTKLMPSARQIFDARDDAVLTYLTDDGHQIEPDFFVPIIPMVLVNGTEGIGTGFSSYVPPYNPIDIKKNLRKCLKGGPPEPMTPWFRGFRGTVSRGDDPHEWITEGIFTVDGTTVTVSELPPGRWIQDYKEYLDEVIEKKVISGYKNSSTTDVVFFEIYGYQGADPIKDFKLRKTFRTSNMHLFHPITGIKRYVSPEEILMDFLEVRLEYYKKRKEYLTKTLTERTRVMETKARFIQLVISEEILIFKKKKTEIEMSMLAHKFKSDSFEGLFSLKTSDYTEESIDALTKKSRELRAELEKLKKTSIATMYENDIDIS